MHTTDSKLVKFNSSYHNILDTYYPYIQNKLSCSNPRCVYHSALEHHKYRTIIFLFCFFASWICCIKLINKKRRRTLAPI